MTSRWDGVTTDVNRQVNNLVVTGSDVDAINNTDGKVGPVAAVQDIIKKTKDLIDSSSRVGAFGVNSSHINDAIKLLTAVVEVSSGAFYTNAANPSGPVVTDDENNHNVCPRH